MNFPKQYDVIIVGGGHAGTEAALAAARTGVSTLLLTHNIDTVGVMSCNPAIGGIGKSHLVKEIDALGGAMAIAADRAGIQWRTLNSRKGPAVRATRAQADRQLYRAAIRAMIESQPGLEVFAQAVDDLIVQGDQVKGVVTQTGIQIHAQSVVLTAGTFLNGKIHVGTDHYPGGRMGDSPSLSLAARLKELPIRRGRLKTGTPARIDARSVDFSKMIEQPGDAILPVMSYLGNVSDHPKQVSCHITHTTERTHDLIRANLNRSAMFSGNIEGVGPRYCPSIEDKITRFADKNSHQVFVEPEGLTTYELYPNGISTSLPFDVQVEFIRSMPGFENAHITRPGYAIEYDYFNPQDLKHSLETKYIRGLFFAGQINGTTGYEEAGAQGLLAGLNAARHAQELAMWYPKRDEAYIGVLVDDLITMGTKEPYRMFTSRAEYRLLLREDNADVRLTPTGRQLGLVDDHRWQAFTAKQENIAREQERIRVTYMQPSSDAAMQLSVKLRTPLTREFSLADLLKRPEVSYQDLHRLMPSEQPLSCSEQEQVEISVKYEGYIRRQLEEIESIKRYEQTELPPTLDIDKIGGLSNEVKQKLLEVKPGTLAQASRIPGVTPAAISMLLVHIKKHTAVVSHRA